VVYTDHALTQWRFLIASATSATAQERERQDADPQNGTGPDSKNTTHGVAIISRPIDSGVASYGARASPSTSNNFILVYFRVNLSANYHHHHHHHILDIYYTIQYSKYCVVCQSSLRRRQQLTALSITKLLVIIKQLLHPALKSAVSAPWRNSSFAPPRNESWRRHCPQGYVPRPTLTFIMPQDWSSQGSADATPRARNKNFGG